MSALWITGKSISKGAALTVPEGRTLYALEVNSTLTNNRVLTVNGIAKLPKGTVLKNLGKFTIKGSILVGDTRLYAVDFDSRGGSPVERQYVVSGEKAEEPDLAPTREGYVFDGWYASLDENVSKFDFFKPIT